MPQIFSPVISATCQQLCHPATPPGTTTTTDHCEPTVVAGATANEHAAASDDAGIAGSSPSGRGPETGVWTTSHHI